MRMDYSLSDAATTNCCYAGPQGTQGVQGAQGNTPYVKHRDAVKSRKKSHGAAAAASYSASVDPMAMRADSSMNYMEFSKERSLDLDRSLALREGATVEGCRTGQTFRQVVMDLETDYVLLKVFLKGYDPKVESVREPVQEEVLPVYTTIPVQEEPKTNMPEIKFCTNCGRAVAVPAPNFCGNCGSRIAQSGVPGIVQG